MLEDTFTTVTNGFTAITKDGYKVIMNRDHVSGNKTPDVISKNNPYVISNINQYIKNNNYNLELLSNTYISNTSKMKWKCQCGNIFEMSWSSLTQGQHLCQACSRKIKGEQHRIDLSIVYDYLNKFNYSLLDNINTNTCITNQRLNIQDKDSYCYSVRWHELKRGKLLEKFHPKNTFTIKNINHYLEINQRGDYKCISKKYTNNGTPMEFIHTICGSIFKSKWIDMMGKQTRSKTHIYYPQCPKCKTTKTESTHASVLKQVFMHEYPDTVLEDRSCTNPVTKRALPTDIVNHRLKIVVEIQSQWHDKEYKKQLDKFKKNYWINIGYKFYDPDIRDYSILELIQLFFPYIKNIPNYVDYNFSNCVNFVEIQKLIDDGYTISQAAKKLNINKYTISGLVHDKKVTLPTGYIEKVFKMKPIVRLSLDGKFIKRYNSLKDIKEDNFAPGTVRRVLVKQQDFSYNSFWLYEDEYKSNQYIIPKVKPDKFLLPIEKYDLNNNYICSYASIYEAENDSMSSRNEIYRVATGDRKSSRNEKWKFKTENNFINN